MEALVLEAFEQYMGGKRWMDEFKVCEEKGFTFCELCGRANLLSNTVPTIKSKKIGSECGCVERFYKELDKKYHHERILGLKPGWIVLGTSELSVVSTWPEDEN